MNFGYMQLGDMVGDCVEDSGRWFPGKAQTLPNLVLCLAGEVGEVANLVKKIVRGSIELDEGTTLELAEEVVDSLIYLCNLMGHDTFKDIDWERLWLSKRAFNEARFGLQCIKPDDQAREAFEKEHFSKYVVRDPSALQAHVDEIVGTPRVARLPQQVRAEAGLEPERKQNWQTGGDFAS